MLLMSTHVSEAFDHIRSSLELNALSQNVKESWLIEALKNFETLKNEVHKVRILG
ncbi:15166_t:CDS:2, partial [Entrophospora sp. SA101]